MAHLVISFKRDDRSMAHLFFGESLEAAEAALRAHAEICPKFGPAFRSSETVEFAREIEELPPQGDPDALEEWLDDLLNIEDEYEEEDEG